MPAETPEDLARTFADLARQLQAAAGVQDTLQRIVDLAVEIVEPCEHAGVSMVHGRRVETAASSSEVPRHVDAIQYETDQGPCLDAIRDEEVFRADDLSTDERWDAFATRAVEETGVRSMMSFRLFVQEDTMGALNLYASEPRAFPEQAEPLGTVLAAHAAIAIGAAKEHERVDQLNEAQLSNRQIGQAVGILMATHGIDSDRAFDLLASASSRLNIKLREVASRVVESQESDATP